MPRDENYNPDELEESDEAEEEESKPAPKKSSKLPVKKPQQAAQPLVREVVKEYFADPQLQIVNDKINVLKADLEEMKLALKKILEHLPEEEAQ